ncbi:MAG: succinate dehydrogenase, cytochrome b556 subunit [Anaerolineales bacterium]|nr:succinate dehydrogenase, cytochrome b556 subunit [Anaerolineales bacterium]MCB8966096.1 succinate dehydrogenase, cytochrome b556 subunit [Ardenticatenaceae bacterium]
MQEIRTTHDAVRPKNPLRAWFDVRKRNLGSWAFALNRLTGLALTVYLFLHLAILSKLLQGESGWNEFLALARSPLFLLLDIILIFGILFHGLNGIRVALVGMGVGARQHRRLFWVLMVIGTLLLLVSAWKVFTI